MKARKKGSNYEWENVAYVQLEGSDILFKEQYLEFQQDESPTELKTNDQVADEKHWQDVRERAAIAIMPGIIANSNPRFKVDANKLAKDVIEYADELVKLLKNGKTEISK